MYEYVSDSVGSTLSAINITNMYVTPVTLTAAKVVVSKIGMTEEPTQYRVVYTKLNSDRTPNGSPQTLIFNVTDTTEQPEIQVTGLTSGALYQFAVTAYKSSDRGNTLIDYVEMNISKNNSKVISGGIESDKISSNKGFLSITGPKEKNKFSVITKEFPAITLPNYTVSTYAEHWAVDEYLKSYSTRYYSFGTSLFLDSTITSPKQGAGIGFFTNSEGTQGYFIIVESTALAASNDRKSIRIIKTDGQKVFKLNDSQTSTSSTFEGVYGGKQYDIDIKVKVLERRVSISAYINGFKITAIDELAYDVETEIVNYIVNPTKNVTLLCSMGTAYFDYIYAMDLDEPKYSNSEYQLNVYRGQFSNDTLDNAFGDLVYSANDDSAYIKTESSIEEFGTTAREILKTNVRFSSRPSFPLNWGAGNNKLVKILSSKVSNFGAESYVLNNTSTTVPLSDGNMASYYLFGNTLSPSGDLEYSTEKDVKYSVNEPVTFQSKWLQNINDVTSLANWIKTNVINKGKVVSMEVFGNPLISVGDIISIDYAYQGFDGTEKFIVTNVSQSYQEGLSTNIGCRLIVN